jgi:tetratricopeptide (TPR) repeat protein
VIFPASIYHLAEFCKIYHCPNSYDPNILSLKFLAANTQQGVFIAMVNLYQQITAIQDTIKNLDPAADPIVYARTQADLGNAYADLAQVETSPKNLHQARLAYETALQYFSPEATLLDYVLTHNSLGNIYLQLSEMEARAENLQRAVLAYEATLKNITPQAAATLYAATQINRGHIYALLAEFENPDENLNHALSAYEQALLYCGPEQSIAYATLQFGLGNICRQLAENQDRSQNLQRAITAYHEALQIYTPLDTPMPYAMTQANLGLTYQALDELPTALTCWHEAVGIMVSFGAKDEAQTYFNLIAEVEAKLKR